MRSVFLKSKNDTIQLVDIQVLPRVTFTDGIMLIGIIQPTVVTNFCGRDVHTEDIFFVLTNE